MEEQFQKKARNSPVYDLCQYAKNGGIIKMALLLDQGVDVNAPDTNCVIGWTALHYAAGYNHPTSIKLLLGYGARIGKTDLNGQTPLHIACLAGSYEAVSVLLEN